MNKKELISEIKNYIPFSNNYETNINYQNGIIYNDNKSENSHEYERLSRSKTLSEESYREETTIRMSTQFLDSRYSERDVHQDSIYTTPESNKYLSEKGIKQTDRKNASKQWKVWLTETHESIYVSEYAALLLHSARRGRKRQMFFTRSAHECFKLRHRVYNK